MKKPLKITIVSILGLLSVALAGGSVIAGLNADLITTRLNGTGQKFDSSDFQEAAASSDALCQKIGENSIALLKNNNNVLPLGTKNINVLGWHATDAGFHLSGIGSGSSTIQESKKVTLLKALSDGGYSVNQDFIDMYTKYDSTGNDYKTGNTKRIPLVEPSVNENYYTNEMMTDAKEFSDTALVVISRIGGENVGEIPTYQSKTHGQANDNIRNYLQLSKEEDDLLDLAEENFDKVIVLINSTNQMQVPRLKNDDKIDAVLNVGVLGQSGARAIPKILSGEVNPSGRLTDTWSNDYTKAPSFKNYVKSGNNIAYREDIYFGYKWYETADTMNFFADSSFDDDYASLSGYDAEVTYPFGYGLSYTSFAWHIDKVSLDEGTALKADSNIKLELSVTNTGSVKGADAVELFYSAPYYDGQIEKSSLNLADFAKSTVLEPGQTQGGIEVSLDAYDMASYDCYNKNGNDFTGYELDKGTYTLSLRENSHTLKKMDSDSEKNQLTYIVGDEGIQFEKDPTTGTKVTNQMTGDDAYAGVPIDGSTVFSSSTYLSRSDFANTFPHALNTSGMNSSNISKANNYTSSADKQTSLPALSEDNGLYLYTKKDGSKATNAELSKGENIVINDALVQKIGSDYDSQELSKITDQLSAADCASIVENGGFGTPVVETIGKTKGKDYDGPAGFNATSQTDINGEWTAFPNETLIAQSFSKQIAKEMGMACGIEANLTGLSGWYAPGVNLHRTPFNGRNYEYYSEDAVLSGYLASNVIEGAKSYGLYSYIKHFTLSEPGVNANNLNTWLTEQNYREEYLKPFEIAVKKGKATGIMSAFNSIGGVWAGANYAQNITILREEWGFRGTMITDWTYGGGNMNTTAGLNGGNDIWLTPATHQSPINTSDPTMVYLAKRAAKNVIYTYCNAYTYAKNYDHSKDSQKVTIGTVIKNEQGFPWWIPLLASIDVVVIGSTLTFAFFAFILPIIKKKKSI